jgi:nucleoside-diphosphate-sugar epimerase
MEGCEAVVHAALDRPAGSFTAVARDEDLIRFLEANFLGSIRLMQDAFAVGVRRFVFIATCAVHDVILDDRPLDEAHPLWPRSHYGAHKAALEAFVSSFGRGAGREICSLRPTGIYSLARPVEQSKWADLIARVACGERVVCRGGGKEVHAADVARAVEILLNAEVDRIRGEAFSCCDIPIADRDVAEIANALAARGAEIEEARAYAPKNLIDTTKLRKLGMEFGGRPLLERTVAEILRELASAGFTASAKG